MDHRFRLQAIVAALLLMLCVMVGCASDDSAPADSDGAVTSTTTITSTAPVTTATESDWITGTTKIGRLDASGYQVGAAPELGAPQVDIYPQEGEEIVITDRVGDWFEIEYNGEKGYIHSQYVTIISDPTTTLGFTTATRPISTGSGVVTTATSTASTSTGDATGTTVSGATVVGETTASAADGTTATTANMEFSDIPGVYVDDNWD